MNDLSVKFHVENMPEAELARLFNEPDHSRFLLDYLWGEVSAFVWNYWRSYDLSICQHEKQYAASTQGLLL